MQYAQETQHEKILRGLAVGIALTMYARLEEADPLVTSLSTDKDPVLRRSGMYTLAMAYCGTGSNKAIRTLLHIAVSFGRVFLCVILTVISDHCLKRTTYSFGLFTRLSASEIIQVTMRFELERSKNTVKISSQLTTFQF